MSETTSERPASGRRRPVHGLGRSLGAAGVVALVILALAQPATGAPTLRPVGYPPGRSSCRHPVVPRWFHATVVRAIQLDDGAHGDGATSSPVPSAWARSPYVPKVVCWQGGFDERFAKGRWHGMFAMTKAEVHEIAPDLTCTVVGATCARSVVRVQQQIAGLRWIWKLYRTPKGAWAHIERNGRFSSFPRPGTNDRATLHPFRRCPVDGTIYYQDDFGEARSVGGYHPHSGNDISAPTGRVIRAPFNGLAVAHADNWFAGRYITVTGAHGYVKNVHLSRFGTLGYVQSGTIIGYVGATGDARGPHNHFEWHPWRAPSPLHESPLGFKRVDTAVDPYPFLNDACR